MATLADIPCDRIELDVPEYGAWYADAAMTSGEAPSGLVSLVVGGLEMVGTVVTGASGLDAPERPHATVIGGAGWGRELARPLSYRSDAGVRVLTVLRDLATLAGETIEEPSDGNMGTHFSAPASSRFRIVRLRDVLATMAKLGHVAPWRVDPDGVTRFGARTGTEVEDLGVEMRRDAAIGWRLVGIEDPSAFLPGNTFKGDPIRRLLLRERANKREAMLWH